MKFQLTFKCPDATYDLPRLARKQAEREWEGQAEEQLNDPEDNGVEWIAERAEELEAQYRELVDKFVEYDEYLRVEFDTALGGSVRVIPTKE